MDGRRELMGGLSYEMNIDNYLTIEALEDGLTASLSTNACQYCVDGDGNWKSLAAGVATESINTGQTLSFRGELTPDSNKGIGTFTITKQCNLLGNCMSMLFGDNAANNYSLSGKNYAFKNLFRRCTTLKSVSNSFLPATTLANYCYYGIFDGCTNLTTAPELPATTLTDSCYYCMFYECTNLTTAPALPATTLAKSCYYAMFRSTGLVTAPELPATTLTDSCYSSMFYNCKNLINAPTLPAIILFPYCYNYMFYGCSKLVTAPELPATTLANYCYYMMFYNCGKLTNAPTLPATVLANSCYCYMFSNCTSLTTAPALPATTLANDCYYSMFSGCGSLTTVPELPATILAEGCYKYMFYDCPKLVKAPELPATTLVKDCYCAMFGGSDNLNYIKAMFTTTPGSSYTSGWVNNVSSTGTFVKNPDATWDVVGVDGVPEGWTVVNDGEENGDKIVNKV